MIKNLKMAALAVMAVAGTIAMTCSPAKADIYYHRHFDHARHACFARGGVWDHGVCAMPNRVVYRNGVKVIVR